MVEQMPPTALISEPALAADDLACSLQHALEQYLAEYPRAVLLEEGRVLFEMARSSYSLSSDHGRCVLQLWSEDENCVRTVVGVQARKTALSVKVRRFGRTELQVMQFVADRDTRTPTTRQATRIRFLFAMERLIARQWSDWKISAMRSAMDLEHSFGPAYARGLLTRGQSAWALIAINAEEMPAVIDGILTLGILWLRQCRGEDRGQHAYRRLIHGLRVIVPAGKGAVTASRMAWMDGSLAQWELWELEPQGDALVRIEVSRQGNLKTRLVRAFNPESVMERFATSTARVLELVPRDDWPQVEVRARSVTEVALSLHGLEFARVRHGLVPGSFTRQDLITFGAGANELELTEGSEPLLRELVSRLFASRRADCDHRDALYRLQPERWLEASLRDDLAQIEPSLNLKHIYSQVPAFAAGDRGMLDLLTVNRHGRIAVLELKADDDLHLPLQGLDYWIRVYQLLQQHSSLTGANELQASGYFPTIELAAASPLLYFVAPALRIHPANEIVLTYFAPEIEWTLIAMNEDWRRERQVVFRKHSKSMATLPN